MNSKKEITKKLSIGGLFFIIALVVNGLGSFGFINGLSQKEVSDMYMTLITPSPSTFSIWGVIYTLLIISIIVMVIKREDAYYEKAINKITTLFVISSILNIAWIVTFSYLQIGISTILIFGFLITLTMICTQLRKIHEKKRILLPLTFGLYTGWLFIATIINIAAWLVKIGWGGFGLAEAVWASITLSAGVIIAFLILMSIKNAAFTLPIAWGYFGVYNFLKSAEYQGVEFKFLRIVCIVGIVILIGIAGIQFYKNKFSIYPEK